MPFRIRQLEIAKLLAAMFCSGPPRNAQQDYKTGDFIALVMHTKSQHHPRDVCPPIRLAFPARITVRAARAHPKARIMSIIRVMLPGPFRPPKSFQRNTSTCCPKLAARIISIIRMMLSGPCCQCPGRFHLQQHSLQCAGGSGIQLHAT